MEVHARSLLEWLMAPPAPSWDGHLATWLKRLRLQVAGGLSGQGTEAGAVGT